MQPCPLRCAYPRIQFTTAWSTILETLTGLFNYIADFLNVSR